MISSRVFLLSVPLFLSLGLAIFMNASAQQNSTGLNFDEPVSQIAQKLADYHLKLAQEEKSKGNNSGWLIHYGLAGMSESDLSNMVDSHLDSQQKNKLESSNPGNCILTPTKNVSIDVLCIK